MVLPDAGCRLIMASDGVWDVLNPELVWNLSKRASVETAARLIIERLLVRTYGHPSDDATAMIIDFSGFGRCKSKEFENKKVRISYGHRII